MVSLARPRTRCRSDFVSARTETLRQRHRLRLLRFWDRRVLFFRNRRHRGIDLARCRPRQAAWSRRYLLVRPLPDSPALRHLARTSDSATTGPKLSFHFPTHRSGPERVGNCFGESNQRAGEQTSASKKDSTGLTARPLNNSTSQLL